MLALSSVVNVIKEVLTPVMMVNALSATSS